MKWIPTTRRHFLQGAGGLTLALPTLPSLLPAAARSAVMRPPKRFVAVLSYFGQWFKYWYPEPTSMTKLADDVHHVELASLQGPISSILNTDFDPLRKKLTLIRGLDGLCKTGHNGTFPLTGSMWISYEHERADAFPYSIDHVLETSKRVYPTDPRLPALRLSPHLTERNQSFSWTKRGGQAVRLPSLWNEASAFNKVFGRALPGGTFGPSTEHASSMKSVDLVFEDYRSLLASPRLGADDRQRLTNYVELLQQARRRMDIVARPLACAGAPGRLADAMNRGKTTDQLYANHFDVMVSALACDITRVATIVIHHWSSTDPNLSPSAVHDASHSNPEKNAMWNAWIAKQVAVLLSKMDAITEADGSTLLDNSAVLWSNELGQGEAHVFGDIPVLLAGGLQGQLRTGHFIDYRQNPRVGAYANRYFIGRPYNQLLVTLLEAMGLEPQDYERDGIKGFGTYSGISPEYYQHLAKYVPQRRQHLPFYSLRAG